MEWTAFSLYQKPARYGVWKWPNKENAKKAPSCVCCVDRVGSIWLYRVIKLIPCRCTFICFFIPEIVSILINVIFSLDWVHKVIILLRWYSFKGIFTSHIQTKVGESHYQAATYVSLDKDIFIWIWSNRIVSPIGGPRFNVKWVHMYLIGWIFRGNIQPKKSQSALLNLYHQLPYHFHLQLRVHQNQWCGSKTRTCPWRCPRNPRLLFKAPLFRATSSRQGDLYHQMPWQVHCKPADQDGTWSCV